ncbi:UNVERIFIED_CONTAM: hypothetical protein GTU68_038683 [Idotea baltica]|nr:hypothetical protein [Idotea baltica]
MDEPSALKLASELSGEVWGFKVNDLLLECGVSIIQKLGQHGKVFADAKVHEIPNTTKNSVRRLSKAGASIITVHASGGRAMLQAADDAAGEALVCAVTVLTSLTDADSQEIYSSDSKSKVISFARLVKESGLGGIICSPQELVALNQDEDCRSLAKVCPGVRPSWYGKADDQNRVATPEQAISDGASLLVVGRPITSAENPVEAAKKIEAEIEA